jgi:ferric-dicitrate binding protein FerR (iron transport regulator)
MQMTNDSDHRDGYTQDDAVERLIRIAGKRMLPPADLYERTFQVATDALQRKVRRRLWRAYGVAAAGAILAVFLGWQLQSPPEVAPSIAHIDRIIGPVSIRGEDADWSLTDSSVRAIARGMSIRTESASRAALTVGDRYSVRLAEATELRLLSSGRLQLVAGKMYVASLTEQGGTMVITTAAGEVSDIGTQFEVQLRPEGLRVRVRQGEVAIDRPLGRLRGIAGEELIVKMDGTIRRAKIQPDDAAWQWTQALAPTISIDGQPLTALLRWVERETGRIIRFANVDVERAVNTTILHGDIGSLAPMDALTVMLSTTDFRHRILQDGTIIIESR